MQKVAGPAISLMQKLILFVEMMPIRTHTTSFWISSICRIVNSYSCDLITLNSEFSY